MILKKKKPMLKNYLYAEELKKFHEILILQIMNEMLYGCIQIWENSHLCS